MMKCYIHVLLFSCCLVIICFCFDTKPVQITFKNNCSELFLWVGTHGEIFKKKLSVVLFPISKTISGKVCRV